MKDRLCQYGNCENETVKLTVNYGGERLAFCCLEHAALALVQRKWGRHAAVVPDQRTVDHVSQLDGLKPEERA